MIISTCGFGSTGSSAVTDYLSECESVSVFDKIEFPLAMDVDGLCDLEYHLMQHNFRNFSGIIAMQRFRNLIVEHLNYWNARTKMSKTEILKLTDEYLDSLANVEFLSNINPCLDNNALDRFFRKWLGRSIILNRIILKQERSGKRKSNYRGYPLRMTKMSVRPSNFYEASRRYVHDLMKGMGADFNKIVAADQLFCGNDPVRSFPFFEDPYAIVVDRDPRDIYIFGREKLLSRGRFMPVDNVDDFITYYKSLRDGQPYKEDNPRVLRLRFEDMVYDYDNSADKIDSFLGIKNNNRQTVFIPKMSAANTNLMRKFPQYKDDVKKIEEALPEYIFPFEKFEEIKDDGVMFYGKSLKRK